MQFKDQSQCQLIGLATAENDNIGGTGHPNIVQIKGNGTGQGLVVGNSAGAGRINIHDRRGENTITNGNELAFIGLGGGSPGINRALFVPSQTSSHKTTRKGVVVSSA